MKTAEELLDAFVAQVRPPRWVTLSIAERPSGGRDDPNWVAGIGSVPITVADRFATCIAAFRTTDPIIDWSPVTARAGERRRVGINLPEPGAFDADHE